MTPTARTVQSVLVLEADRLYGTLLRRQIRFVFPVANVSTATSTQSAVEHLATAPFDLVVLGAGDSLEGDLLDLLSRSDGPPLRMNRVLMVVARHELRLLNVLRSLDVAGVFDSAHEDPMHFGAALRMVAQGGRYWSPSVVLAMQQNTSAAAIFRILTNFEQLVLSVVGDGSDDTRAADELKVSPSTVSTVRRELHRKLGVQHRGELVRVAAQHGFVRFTPGGVVRPGFATLSAAYHARRPRKSDEGEPEPAIAEPPSAPRSQTVNRRTK